MPRTLRATVSLRSRNHLASSFQEVRPSDKTNAAGEKHSYGNVDCCLPLPPASIRRCWFLLLARLSFVLSGNGWSMLPLGSSQRPCWCIGVEARAYCLFYLARNDAATRYLSYGKSKVGKRQIDVVHGVCSYVCLSRQPEVSRLRC